MMLLETILQFAAGCKRGDEGLKYASCIRPMFTFRIKIFQCVGIVLDHVDDKGVYNTQQ